MKALVLAGGTGSRLRPITHTAAKQLVPVANKPVLFYGIESLVAAGVTDIGIIVGDTAAEIRAAVGDGGDFGAKVTYIPQHQPLGLAHAVLVARDYLADDDFVMYLGDNFIVGGINDLVRKFHDRRPDADILLTHVDDPRVFGVAELDESGRVVRLEEKPEKPASDLALVGVYLFTPAVHEAVRAISPSARGELEIVDAIQWLIDQGLVVRSTTISGYWKDTGNVTDMLEVNRSVLETVEPCQHGTVDAETEIIGRVRVERGAVVSQSRIVGPAVIGAGTTVRGSYVGPSTSVAENCVIDGSEIEYSIVLEGASIEGVGRIEASLIGRKVRVTRAGRAPRAHRFILGDHSKVRITP
ncbi:glucose-1-phosphate thymidylyltransferase [Streptomyces profundus]|uniref:glucose-1-phosphate thymidylyltransferase n=1 Tax=Streptomyces profundus TaxID=2867410 RepID=UPI001D1619D4|nr:glucose-1-phosphate thymidylyltransferase [Streptomyces sp. MA3_2.13]UED87192.1 glucose-1-phosphate thymidylyltransferase [Streptomyces sp. MA3_2.13]